MYDMVIFLDLESFIKNDYHNNYDEWIRYSVNKYLFMLNAILKMDLTQLSGVVFPKKISGNWTSGQITIFLHDEFVGTYIEYGVSPRKCVKYRVVKNSDGSCYIDRYVDTSDDNYSMTNISYQILYRNTENHTYVLYGIDFEDNLSNLINNG